MILPYEADVPFDREPWANYIVLAVTVAVSLSCLVEPRLEESLALGQRDVPDFLRDQPPLLVESTILKTYPIRFEWHDYFTYGFVHGGIIHLAGNMLFLFAFGNAVRLERE